MMQGMQMPQGAIGTMHQRGTQINTGYNARPTVPYGQMMPMNSTRPQMNTQQPATFTNTARNLPAQVKSR